MCSISHAYPTSHHKDIVALNATVMIIEQKRGNGMIAIEKNANVKCNMMSLSQDSLQHNSSMTNKTIRDAERLLNYALFSSQGTCDVTEYFDVIMDQRRKSWGS